MQRLQVMHGNQSDGMRRCRLDDADRLRPSREQILDLLAHICCGRRSGNGRACAAAQ
jgi:hypothetical protein